MSYAEFPPPRDLAGSIACIWRFQDPDPGPLERIVPDGRCELVWHGDSPFLERAENGDWRVQPRLVFAGQLTRPLHLRAQGPADVIAVRFRHAAARAFFGAPMQEATDRRIDLGGALDHAHRDAESLLAFVRERNRAVAYAPDAVVERCVDRIVEDGASVEALLADAAIGRRQLERRFAAGVGVGPALCAAIVRFRRVFDELDRGGARPWTDAAIAAGYSDQSHFIREFRRFVGCTPGEFAKSSTGLSAALVGNAP